LKCLVVNDPVGSADLLRDPGRPLVNATGNFWVKRSLREGMPQHGLGVGVLGVSEGETDCRISPAMARGQVAAVADAW